MDAKTSPHHGFVVHCAAYRRFFRAATVTEAVDLFTAWRDAQSVGARAIGGTLPLYRLLNASGIEREQIGTVGYNGRIHLDVQS